MSDKFDSILSERKALLLDCQKEKGLHGCLECETLFECLLRKSYVDAVYASMNKGLGGDFDF